VQGRLVRTRWRDRSDHSAHVVVAGGIVAAGSTLLDWFSYRWVTAEGVITETFPGAQDVTGRAMLVAGLLEAALAVLYIQSSRRHLRSAVRPLMIAIGFFMLFTPLAAIMHTGAVPGTPPMEGLPGVADIDQAGAFGLLIALAGSVAVFAGSWLTLLDTLGSRTVLESMRG
jgi:hypothetical protein